MADDLNLATQGGSEGNEGAASDGSQQQDGGNVQQQQEWRLKVNDRTEYKSPEEAIRGFAEGQQRITSLTPFQRLAEQYLGKENATPENVKALFDELVSVRTKAAAEAAKKAAGDDPELEGKTPQQIAEIKAAKAWFDKEAERRGFVSKDALAKLEAKLAAIENAPQVQDKRARDEAASSGETELRAQLKASNVTLSDDEFTDLASGIQAYIDSSQKRVGEWQQALSRGNIEKTNELIMAGARYALGFVKPGAKFVDPVSAKIQSAQNKNQLQRQVPRKLPQQGAAAGAAAAQKTKFTGLGDKRLTDAALAKMDELMGATAD